MKKFALALMCAVSVLLLGSCTKKTEEVKYPTIKFVNAGAGYVYEDKTVTVDTIVGVKIEAVATDAKDLLASVSCKVIFNNETAFDTTITLKDQTTYTYENIIPVLWSGLYTVEATVTTKANRTATAKVNITAVEAVLEVHDLTWQRLAGMASATGLEEFGLQWKSNYKDVFASIKPVEGALFFRFNGVDFASITGKIAKTVLFSQGEQITEFHEISCFAGATFDYVLGTVYNNNLYLINLTNSTVESSPLGTSVTINGQWK